MERRLTAILAADVVGYSRLMGANEVGTLQSLQAHQSELIEPRIREHHGRVVKLMGDGILAEFASVVEAVECAAAIQQAMPARNVGVPEDRRIEYRIGINLGDVIVKDNDLFGDGVNVAARIEGIARPGGVAVSASVRENVANRISLAFDDRGDQTLKNIERPVRVYDLILEAASTGGARSEPVANRPSIAVLPFTNMSGDPEQEYFSDGIAEDLITDLGKISELFVIGRNTSFTYKGKPVQLQKVARELGVRFLMEGSVRKAGQRVRVTAQLIDGSNGGHLWADRYDRDLTDIFAIQDEITHAILDQLKIRLMGEEKQAIAQVPTDDVEAYSHYLKGRQFFANSTKWFLGLARQMFSRAVEIDPAFARAYAGIANCDTRLKGWYGMTISLGQILVTAEKALALAPDLAEAHVARGEALSCSGRREEGGEVFERALALDPNNFDAHLCYGRHARRGGDAETAAFHFIRALEVQPDDYQAPLLLQAVLRGLGREMEADRYARLGLKRAEEALRLHPESSRPAQLGACALAAIGEPQRARQWLERALAVDADDTHVKYNSACAYAQLGETERAIDLLEQWSHHVGVENVQWLKHDGDCDPLRSHPRFIDLLRRIERELPFIAASERVATQ